MLVLLHINKIGGSTMALMNCPECKKSISDTVSTCPNCGFTITQEMKEQETQKQSKKKKVNKVLDVILAVTSIILIFCVIAIILVNNQEKKVKAKLYEKYSQEVGKYLELYDDVVSYRTNEDIVYVYVSNKWFSSDYKVKEDFYREIRDLITSAKISCGLSDGYYATVYFLDTNKQDIAKSDTLGNIEIQK